MCLLLETVSFAMWQGLTGSEWHCVVGMWTGAHTHTRSTKICLVDMQIRVFAYVFARLQLGQCDLSVHWFQRIRLLTKAGRRSMAVVDCLDLLAAHITRH